MTLEKSAINVTTTSSEDGKIFTLLVYGFKPLSPMQIIQAVQVTLLGMIEKYERALKK